MILYHNTRCRTSRTGLQLIEEHKAEFTIREYLKKPFSKKELTSLLKKSSLDVNRFMRKTEADYKTHFKGRELTIDQTVELLIQYPKVIQRPLLETKTDVLVGRPPELFLDALTK